MYIRAQMHVQYTAQWARTTIIRKIGPLLYVQCMYVVYSRRTHIYL